MTVGTAQVSGLPRPRGRRVDRPGAQGAARPACAGCDRPQALPTRSGLRMPETIDDLQDVVGPPLLVIASARGVVGRPYAATRDRIHVELVTQLWRDVVEDMCAEVTPHKEKWTAGAAAQSSTSRRTEESTATIRTWCGEQWDPAGQGCA